MRIITSHQRATQAADRFYTLYSKEFDLEYYPTSLGLTKGQIYKALRDIPAHKDLVKEVERLVGNSWTACICSNCQSKGDKVVELEFEFSVAKRLCYQCLKQASDLILPPAFVDATALLPIDCEPVVPIIVDDDALASWVKESGAVTLSQGHGFYRAFYGRGKSFRGPLASSPEEALKNAFEDWLGRHRPECY